MHPLFTTMCIQCSDPYYAAVAQPDQPCTGYLPLVYQCQNGHALSLSRVSYANGQGFICNVCAAHHMGGTERWWCSACHYDVCLACRGATPTLVVQATNRAGFAMAPGSETGLLYCGRRMGVAVIPGSDGQCGPTNGPQCPDCIAAISCANPQSAANASPKLTVASPPTDGQPHSATHPISTTSVPTAVSLKRKDVEHDTFAHESVSSFKKPKLADSAHAAAAASDTLPASHVQSFLFQQNGEPSVGFSSPPPGLRNPPNTIPFHPQLLPKLSVATPPHSRSSVTSTSTSTSTSSSSSSSSSSSTSTSTSTSSSSNSSTSTNSEIRQNTMSVVATTPRATPPVVDSTLQTPRRHNASTSHDLKAQSDSDDPSITTLLLWIVLLAALAALVIGIFNFMTWSLLTINK
jgi:hypothetical protein